ERAGQRRGRGRSLARGGRRPGGRSLRGGDLRRRSAGAAHHLDRVGDTGTPADPAAREAPRRGGRRRCRHLDHGPRSGRSELEVRPALGTWSWAPRHVRLVGLSRHIDLHRQRDTVLWITLWIFGVFRVGAVEWTDQPTACVSVPWVHAVAAHPGAET